VLSLALFNFSEGRRRHNGHGTSAGAYQLACHLDGSKRMRWAEMVAALYADVVIVGDLERVQRKQDG